MTAFQIALGAVFEVESSPYAMRVIAFDDAEVMYDVWWPHKEAWGMARLSGDFTYCRLPRSHVDANAQYIRTDSLSEMELRVHRPDLPFAVAQRKDVSWYDPSWKKGVFETSPILASSNIYLSPFGPRDSAKPAGGHLPGRNQEACALVLHLVGEKPSRFTIDRIEPCCQVSMTPLTAQKRPISEVGFSRARFLVSENVPSPLR